MCTKASQGLSRFAKLAEAYQAYQGFPGCVRACRGEDHKYSAGVWMLLSDAWVDCSATLNFVATPL